jgi:hypothetical protein
MPGSLDRFRFDPHATGEEELARRRAVAYHISGFAHWEGIKVSETLSILVLELALGRLIALTSSVVVISAGRPRF